MSSSSSSSSSAPTEWKAWPGGLYWEPQLNPTESFSSADFGFSGNVDWNVGAGGVVATIVETGTTTATNRASITVRYDFQSPTAAEGDTVFVQATKAGQTKTKKRTVFSVSWSLKFSGPMHEDTDKLFRFPAITGTDRKKCEFNWDGTRGAERTSAKMEATCSFSPTGINWSARGVTFKYSVDGGGAKGDLRLHRRIIATDVSQKALQPNRIVVQNDSTFVPDGDSDPQDCQLPTATKPDRAFRIDAPGFNSDTYLQIGLRLDLWEITEWCDGTSWKQFSLNSDGGWYTNATAVLPIGTEGGTNNHGPDSAENVPNTQPTANAGPNQTVNSGATVTLDGSGSSDADNDTVTYKWTKTAGPNVTLDPSDTVQKPTFTAPTGPETLTFELKVTDITKDLHHHKPTNSESTADSVTITVNAP